MLGGGLDRGTSTLIMGPAGSGKSTLGTLYAVNAVERGEKAVVFTFDEGIETLLTRTHELKTDRASESTRSHWSKIRGCLSGACRLSRSEVSAGDLLDGKSFYRERNETQRE